MATKTLSLCCLSFVVFAIYSALRGGGHAHLCVMAAAPPLQHGPLPDFNNNSKFSDFTPLGHPNFDTAFRSSDGGAFGRAIRANWQYPAGGDREVILKVMLGPPRGHVPVPGDERTRTANFSHEESVLFRARYPTWAHETDPDTGLITPHAAGVGYLCFTYCTGVEADGYQHLPSTIPHVPGAPTPVYLIAMEPLTGGTLWARMGLNPEGRVLVGTPLDPLAALWAAADLMAGLSALHKLGYAHADLKCVHLWLSR
jgi:hypothetical protein